ncbi:winged helix-turn-helix transcriptional regulator [Streptomyces bathyalis]|uniref:Winged helix-turn-helix transcriptional regulator n=1 Tax=Streptomyces bathyalis TaxID=2710756 RepID=A0A7T1WUM5_9ACTN|nr:winged helix-turn-helix domain-containing protein [Streptomyces bathyalis]QPP08065.1 winged helix-turn-helix transcriptional regulator [Streptomyces bathyalis]
MNRTSPAKGARPSHEVVAAALRERIDSGELPPEARIPTQNKLAEEFGVNRTAVRQAIQDLQRQGLLTDPGRGAPPTVARPDPSHEEPKPAGTELAERLYEAFRAEHVTIDTYSLTTETLNNALARPHRSIVDGTISPRSITLRAITPSPEAYLALPRLIDDPNDRRPLDRLHEIQRTWSTALRNTLGTFRNRYEVPEVSCEIRTVAATPLHKLYILNRTEALMGYYQVVPDEVTYQGETLEIFDVLGFESSLFRFHDSPGSHDKQDVAFVGHSQAWFDSLWKTIATPLDSD